MQVIKEGGHRLFEQDRETTKYVSDLLADIEARGMDAVRSYSEQFDKWSPRNFELSPQEIQHAIDACDEQLVRDTE